MEIMIGLVIIASLIQLTFGTKQSDLNKYEVLGNKHDLQSTAHLSKSISKLTFESDLKQNSWNDEAKDSIYEDNKHPKLNVKENMNKPENNLLQKGSFYAKSQNRKLLSYKIPILSTISDELFDNIEHFVCNTDNSFTACDSKRFQTTPKDGQNFIPWGGKRILVSPQLESKEKHINKIQFLNIKRNYNSWGGKRSIQCQPTREIADKNSSEFVNRKFKLLASRSNYNADKESSNVQNSNTLKGKKNYYWDEGVNKLNSATSYFLNLYPDLNIEEETGKKPLLFFNRVQNFNLLRNYNEREKNSQMKHSSLQNSDYIFDKILKQPLELEYRGNNLKNILSYSQKEENILGNTKVVNNLDSILNKCSSCKGKENLRTIRSLTQPEGEKETNISENYSLSTPYRNLRNFEPWAGKRNLKRLDPMRFKEEQIFQRNLRSFGAWGGKRNYNSWGGKRNFQPHTNILDNNFSHRIGELPPADFQIKNIFMASDVSKRDFPDSKFIFLKGDINTWINKTRKFNSWGGKRTLVLT